MRNTKTEYVSCPSCGRTLFDLQEVTEQIRQRTGHLPGVAIAVMGCIVNGPGEMADADFGYVGGAPGEERRWWCGLVWAGGLGCGLVLWCCGAVCVYRFACAGGARQVHVRGRACPAGAEY